VDDHFLQNYLQNLQVFLIKFVAKNVLYKIFCKKIGGNFLQIFFNNKICKYFVWKKIQNKIDRKYKFF